MSRPEKTGGACLPRLGGCAACCAEMALPFRTARLLIFRGEAAPHRL
jgi:hypothetical protein